MRAHIEQLEARARLLEPEPARRAEWLKTVEKYAEDFLQRIEELPAYNHRPDRGRGLLDVPLGQHPFPLDELLAILEKEVDSTGINPASGGHLGYIPGGGVFPTALGDFLAAVTNRYAGIFFGNPGAVRMEHQLLRWMCRLVGYPQTALGNLASGGSIANLIAIVTAR
ncbi:MAG: amino acid decarboxylase, partial [Bacteroidetes bacterium]